MKMNYLALMLMAMFAVAGCSEAEETVKKAGSEAASNVGGGTATEGLDDAKGAVGNAMEKGKEAIEKGKEAVEKGKSGDLGGATEAGKEAVEKGKEAVTGEK